jgi:hypothetical protein
VVVFKRCFPLLPMGVPLTTDMLPAIAPPDSGAKVTESPMVCWGPSVMGKLGPAKANPEPVTLTCEMDRFDLPVLLTFTVDVLLLPTGTTPKLMFEEPSASWPVAALEHRTNLNRISFHQACFHRKTKCLIGRLAYPVLRTHGGDDRAPPFFPSIEEHKRSRKSKSHLFLVSDIKLPVRAGIHASFVQKSVWRFAFSGSHSLEKGARSQHRIVGEKSRWC